MGPEMSRGPTDRQHMRQLSGSELPSSPSSLERQVARRGRIGANELNIGVHPGLVLRTGLGLLGGVAGSRGLVYPYTVADGSPRRRSRSTSASR